MKKHTYFSDVMELTKARLCLLAVLMALLGYFLGLHGPVNFAHLFWMLVGTSLVGGASGVFNQFIEIEIDRLMLRTQNRPLPTGRVKHWEALRLGFALAIVGELILLIFVNSLTAIVGAVTLLFYLGVYTPSKRMTPLSTLVGAIPGALPPLMGWTAATGKISLPGILLFFILFLWQIPHFLAIAWVYREDYGRASLPILSVVDEAGSTTAKQIILYSIVLIPLTMVPSVWGLTGQVYLWGALILGLTFFAFGLSLAMHRTVPYARRLFFASIIYLPVLGGLMIWDRTV